MSTAKSPLYIGNHTTSSKGYAKMARQMIANEGNTFAFFTRNPRGGRAKEIDPEDVRKFLELTEEYKFGKIVAHAPYTLNACAANGRRAIIIIFIREVMWDRGQKRESA